MGRRPAGEHDLSFAPGGPASSATGAAAAGWRGARPAPARVQVRPAGGLDKLRPVPSILKLGPSVEKTHFREGFFANFKFQWAGPPGGHVNRAGGSIKV
jgi:hypothetical protein